MSRRTILASLVTAIVAVTAIAIAPSRAATPSRLSPGPVEVEPDIYGDGFAFRVFNPTSDTLHVTVTILNASASWVQEEIPTTQDIAPGSTRVFYFDCDTYCEGTPVITPGKVIVSGYINSGGTESAHIDLAPNDFKKF